MVSPSASLRRALSNHERGNTMNRVLNPPVLRQAQDERFFLKWTGIWNSYLANTGLYLHYVINITFYLSLRPSRLSAFAFDFLSSWLNHISYTTSHRPPHLTIGQTGAVQKQPLQSLGAYLRPASHPFPSLGIRRRNPVYCHALL